MLTYILACVCAAMASVVGVKMGDAWGVLLTLAAWVTVSQINYDRGFKSGVRIALDRVETLLREQRRGYETHVTTGLLQSAMIRAVESAEGAIEALKEESE